jgi:hypothetical protein
MEGELLSLQQDMDYHVLACAQLQVSVSYWCTDITYRWGCQWETHWTVCTAEMLKPWDDDLKLGNVDLKLGNVVFQDDGSFARLPGNSLSISEYANMSNDDEEGSPSEEESEFSDDGNEKDDAAHQGLGFSESAQFTSIHTGCDNWTPWRINDCNGSCLDLDGIACWFCFFMSLQDVQGFRVEENYPSNCIPVSTVIAFGIHANLDEGRKVHGYVIKLGDSLDDGVTKALIVYTEYGSVSCAYRVFQSVPQTSWVSWTAMIMGLAQNG